MVEANTNTVHGILSGPETDAGTGRLLTVGPTASGTTLKIHRPSFVGTMTSPLYRRLIKPTILQPHSDFDEQYDRRWRHTIDGKPVKVIYVAPSARNTVTEQPAEYLHGYNESPGASRLVAQAIYTNGMPYISFEPDANYSMETYAQAATGLMEMVAKASLIGVSMGGVYGTMAASRTPENVGNILYVEPGSIDGEQSNIGLATRTVAGGLTEMGRAYLSGNIKGGLNLTEGLVWAARSVVHNPKNALELIDGIARSSVNGLQEAHRLKSEHSIPSSMIIFDGDQTFRKDRMLRAIRDIEEAYGNPFAIPILTLKGNHFTLATNIKTAQAIADRSLALHQKQLGLVA